MFKFLIVPLLLCCTIAQAGGVCTTSKKFKAKAATKVVNFVNTGFAVPVGVPVAPYSTYWYGASSQYAPQYQQQQSVTGYQQQSGYQQQYQQKPTYNGQVSAQQSFNSQSQQVDAVVDLLLSRMEERLGGKVSSHNVPRAPSAVIALCSNCHSPGSRGATEAALDGFFLEDFDAMTCEERQRGINAIVHDRMPKGKKLTPQEAGALIAELSAIPKDSPTVRQQQNEEPPEPEWNGEEELPPHRPQGPPPPPNGSHQQQQWSSQGQHSEPNGQDDGYGEGRNQPAPQWIRRLPNGPSNGSGDVPPSSNGGPPPVPPDRP